MIRFITPPPPKKKSPFSSPSDQLLYVFVDCDLSYIFYYI